MVINGNLIAPSAKLKLHPLIHSRLEFSITQDLGRCNRKIMLEIKTGDCNAEVFSELDG